MTRDGRLPVINVAPLLSRDADARPVPPPGVAAAVEPGA